MIKHLISARISPVEIKLESAKIRKAPEVIFVNIESKCLRKYFAFGTYIAIVDELIIMEDKMALIKLKLYVRI